MDVSSSTAATSIMASAASVEQLQAVMATQITMLKEVADAQAQVAQMLTDGSVGQNINVTA